MLLFRHSRILLFIAFDLFFLRYQKLIKNVFILSWWNTIITITSSFLHFNTFQSVFYLPSVCYLCAAYLLSVCLCFNSHKCSPVAMKLINVLSVTVACSTLKLKCIVYLQFTKAFKRLHYDYGSYITVYEFIFRCVF